MIVWVEFVLHPEKAEEFIERVKQQARDSLALEEACRHFDVAVDSKQANRVLLYEIYDDAAAFDLHLASAHFREFDAQVASWVVAKKVEILNGPLA